MKTPLMWSDVACPRCAAPAGQPCRTPNRATSWPNATTATLNRLRPHKPRLERARLQNLLRGGAR